MHPKPVIQDLGITITMFRVLIMILMVGTQQRKRETESKLKEVPLTIQTSQTCMPIGNCMNTLVRWILMVLRYHQDGLLLLLLPTDRQ